jgi:hypothetical protein
MDGCLILSFYNIYSDKYLLIHILLTLSDKKKDIHRWINWQLPIKIITTIGGGGCKKIHQRVREFNEILVQILTLYPAISWVTPGSGPTVARLFLSCTGVQQYKHGSQIIQNNNLFFTEMIIPGNRDVAILWMEFMSADLPTLGTPTTIIRSVGSFEIASFSFSSASPRS